MPSIILKYFSNGFNLKLCSKVVRIIDNKNRLRGENNVFLKTQT